VNWASGIDKDGRPTPNPAKEPSRDGRLVAPDEGGGTNYRSPSFDPKTGLFIVSARDAYAIYFFKEEHGKYGWAGADYGVTGLKEDLDKWFAEVTPVLGETDILVYPTGGDIKGQEAYSGSKYDALHGYGFRYFVGTGSGASWGMTATEYARHTRTIVSAVNLTEHPDWFAGMFDAATVLSAER
jgi:hypothetical protein